MRTTLTLDSDVAKKLKDLAHIERRPFKQVVNEILRAGLGKISKPSGQKQRFRVNPKHCGFRPGIDTGKLNQLADELVAEDSLLKASGRL